MNGLNPKIVSGATPQSFVVADSTFWMDIKDVTAIQSGNHIASDKISLNLRDAYWRVIVAQSGAFTWFYANLFDIPVELRGKTQKMLSVLCKGKEVHARPFAPSVSDDQITDCIMDMSNYYQNNAIHLNFRLVITCEDLSLDIYDPQDSRKAVLGNVAAMLGDPTFADFTFIVEGRGFKVHMNILAAASPVLRQMFTSDMEEAKTKTCRIDAIDAETFDQLLRFIYRSEVPKDLKAVAKPLYEAAHYYEIEELKKNCARKINKDLSIVNAMEVFEWTQPYDDFEQLKLDAWAIVKRDILKIVVKLKKEPLTMNQVHAVIKQRKQEEKFWMELEEEEKNV